MKKTATTLFLTFLFFSAFSQALVESPQKQFGFDAAGFLARFFNFSGNGSTGSDPFYLTYRKYGEKKNTRLGLGLAISIEGDGNDGTNTQNIVNFRAGNERFKDFGKAVKRSSAVPRWRAFYGWDFILTSSFSSTGSTDNSFFQIGAGPAPFFGLQYRINEHLSVSSEISYNMFLTFRDNNGTSRLGFATAFDSPTAVYVNYDF